MKRETRGKKPPVTGYTIASSPRAWVIWSVSSPPRTVTHIQQHDAHNDPCEENTSRTASREGTSRTDEQTRTDRTCVLVP